jgi:hypothetical protein
MRMRVGSHFQPACHAQAMAGLVRIKKLNCMYVCLTEVILVLQCNQRGFREKTEITQGPELESMKPNAEGAHG